MSNEAEDEQLRIDRIGRLIGVILKMPFARPSSLESPSYRTRAYRAWNLVEEASFYSPERQQTPQYQTLEAVAAHTAERALPLNSFTKQLIHDGANRKREHGNFPEEI